MTARGFYTLLFGALMLFTALSVGSAGAFLLGTAALLCWALSLLCVCAAALSLCPFAPAKRAIKSDRSATFCPGH